MVRRVTPIGVSRKVGRPTVDRAVRAASHSVRERVSTYRDQASGYSFVAAAPSAAPDLWNEYIARALGAYRRFGVESALEYESVRSGESTAIFCAGLDRRGVVVGGVRAQGPYQNADESHALTEWSAPKHVDHLRRMIESRIPFGLIEAKAAWVSEDVPKRRELTLAVARMGAKFMGLLDSRYMMATAADNLLDLWKTCGGMVDPSMPATPYPDARYRTRLMWWDRLRTDPFGDELRREVGGIRFDGEPM